MSAKISLVRAADGVEWRPDGAFAIRVADRSTITAHPIEDRQTVVDHTQAFPVEVSFVAVLSPVRAGQARDDSGQTVGAGLAGGDYVSTMVEWLRAAKNLGQVVVIDYDRSDIGGDFLVASCSRSFSSSGTDTDIAVSLVEARFARSETTVVGPEYGPLLAADNGIKSGFASTNNGGDAPTSSVTEEEADKVRQKSNAAKVFDALLGGGE